LALLVGPQQAWLTTEQFLDVLDAELHSRIAAPAGVGAS
jgi:hypothetical protein